MRKLRLRAAFFRDETAAASTAGNLRVTRSIHRSTVAELVALEAYPARRLINPGLTIAVSFVLTVLTVGFLLLDPDATTDSEGDPAGLWPILGVVALVSLAFQGFYQWWHVKLERWQIARSYLDGDRVAAEISEEPGYSKIVSETLRWGGLLQLLARTIGQLSMAAAITAVGCLFVERSAGAGPEVFEKYWSWIVVGGIVSALGWGWGSQATDRLLSHTQSHWEHPRPGSGVSSRGLQRVGSRALRSAGRASAPPRIARRSGRRANTE